MWKHDVCPVCWAPLTKTEHGAWCPRSITHYVRGTMPEVSYREVFARLGFSDRTGRWSEKAWCEGWEQR